MGLDILKRGGNATAAVLTVVEPMSTSHGGDAFIMVYIAKEKKLVGGRAAYGMTLDRVNGVLTGGLTPHKDGCAGAW